MVKPKQDDAWVTVRVPRTVATAVEDLFARLQASGLHVFDEGIVAAGERLRAKTGSNRNSRGTIYALAIESLQERMSARSMVATAFSEGHGPSGDDAEETESEEGEGR